MPKLTLGDLFDRMRKAIAEKRLAIQYPDQLRAFVEAEDGTDVCLNAYPEEFFDGKICCCIVGATLSPEAAKEQANGYYVDTLHHFGFLKTTDHEIFAVIGRLQTIHDNLIGQSIERPPEVWAKKADEFMAMVGRLTPENAREEIGLVD